MSQAAPKIKRAPIMVALIIGAFVAILNQTLLNVALPKIMESLSISTNTAQWLMTGFMLVNGVLIPISAYLIGKFSTRQLFITAMALFTLGTLLCAVSGNFGLLMTGRVVQALGAGILMPLMTVVTLTIFPVEERGKAMGVMGIAMIFAPAVGPTLSGWIVQHYDWNVLFYMLLPLSAIALIFGIFFIKNVGQRTNPKLDTLGVILSTLGFGGLLFGFSEAGNSDEGWGSTTVIVSLAIGAVTLLLFAIRELRTSGPVLEFRVFKYNMFSLTTVINVIVTMAMFAGMVLTPIYLQNILGFTPVKSGLLLLPGAIVMGLMMPVTGAIFDKIGARWLAVIGLAITAAATWEFTRLTVDTTYTHLIWVYTIRMFGMGLLMMPIQTAGLNQLPQRLNAHGSAMSQTLRNVAGALGTALLVSIMSNKTRSVLTETIISQGIKPTDAAKMLDATRHATVTGINHAFLYSFWFTIAALVLAFFIQKTRPSEEQAKETQTAQPAAASSAQS
ncbi:DHA2 family efflux MFS transporter permease subunit [Cohnella laeviribosi]|uniref:DHA2 family efflux MFS transporter permease subunit n=1 Tax=Cohnella laeviribosi TaxID=380174 RepID=UPI000526AD9F|nr:DHA2 family efflux MFS transporter permease subunit [Cohnella laeviribosi]